MITLEDIDSAIKDLARRNPFHSFSHCQNLDHHIQNLGFKNRHHLKTYLNAQNKNSPIFTDLIKKICAARLPCSDLKYGMLQFVPYRTGYNSYLGDNIDVLDAWVGLDANYYDVRTPSGDCDALRVVSKGRDENETVYVIESLGELKSWEKLKWDGQAVVSYPLIESYYSYWFANEKKVIENYDIDHAHKIITARTEIRHILNKNKIRLADIF